MKPHPSFTRRAAWSGTLVLLLLVVVALLAGCIPRGQLTVESSPGRAEVQINGEHKGKTPLVLKGLKPGVYNVSVTLRGYEPYRQKVEVKDGPVAVNAELVALPVKLRVATEPADAFLYLNGRAAGYRQRTFEGLAPGPLVLRVEKEGYETWEKTVRLEPGDNAVRVVLEKGNRGRLGVASDRDGDRVYLDGVLIGRTPLQSYKVAPGRHVVKVVRDGKSWEGIVWGFSAGRGDMVPTDLTVVRTNLAAGWTLRGYPFSRLAAQYGGAWGWTPDGARAVFNGRGIQFLNLDTFEVRKTDVMAWDLAGWSPDGRLLAFTGDGLVGTLKPDGTEVKTYEYDRAGIPEADGYRVLWHPDGRHLLVEAAGEWESVYWLLDLESGKARPFIDGLQEKFPGRRVTVCGFLPGGEVLAEVRSYIRRDGTSAYTEAGYFADVGVCDPEAGAITFLTEAAEGQYYHPLGVSPDGQRAYFELFERKSPYDEQVRTALGFVNTDRSGAQVAVRGEKLGSGSWSPDGKQLLYVSGGARLTLADAGGENARALFTVPNTGWQPGFSIDRIVWSQDGSKIWLFGSDGTAWFAVKD